MSRWCQGLAWLVVLVALPVAISAPSAHAQDPGSETEAAPVIVRPALISPAPSVERIIRRRGLAVAPIVRVTVGVDGSVSSVEVLQGPDGPARQRLIAEVEALRFSPATRDGLPVAVRIDYALPVPSTPAWRGRGRRGIEPVPVVAEGVYGVVLERGTRTPLAGIPVQVLNDDREALAETVTGPDGEFALPNLPQQSFTLWVPAFDHEPLERPVTVPIEQALTLRLQPNSTSRYKTVVTGKTADAVKIVIPVQQAREVAGQNGDPIKVLESLPGVARPSAAGAGAGQISIRGSAPEDTKYYVDGLPLFQLYHFANVYSVLQDEWVKNIDYRPGGFSAEYGNAMGGLLNVTLDDLKRDNIHGHVDVNVFHAAVLVTAPISDEWAIGVGFRRSYIDVILDAVLDGDGFSLTAAPRYYDYQIRADWRPDDRQTLRLTWFGTDDLLAVVNEAPSEQDPSFTGFRLARRFHQIQGSYTNQLSDRLGLRLGLATSYQQLEIQPGGFDFELTFDPITLRADLEYRESPELKLRGGLLTTITRFNVLANIPAPDKEGEVDTPGSSRPTINETDGGFTYELAAWAEATWKPVEDLTLIGGMRLLGYAGNNLSAVALDPRLLARWDIDNDAALTLAAGMNHQSPQADETSTSFGAPTLTTERSMYINLGYKQQLGEFLEFDVQAFYKDLADLVTNTDAFGAAPYDNAGVGHVLGAELLLRLNHPIVNGWVSYTLSRSRRRDRPGEPERYYSADQTHVLAVVAGVDLGANWRFGLRFRYATGNPFTPLAPSYYDASADVFVPAAAAAPLSSRIDGFTQLDVRIDKTWIFETWRLKLYLELQNATNAANTEAVDYNYDYTERDDITGLPIIPSLGIRASF